MNSVEVQVSRLAAAMRGEVPEHIPGLGQVADRFVAADHDPHALEATVREQALTLARSTAQQRTSAGVGIVCSLTGWCESGAAQVAIQVAGQAWFARHSREDEREADSVAVETLARTGYAPSGVPEMFGRLLAERQRAPLGVEQWFASHPLEEERIAATRAHVARLDPAALEGLAEDDAAFQAFKARLAALPPPPQPPGQPQ